MTEASILPREFYLRDTLQVARDLLGMELVRTTPEGTTSGIIVETEGYLGLQDRAAHAFRGKRGGRVEVMYLPGGLAYVYLIYGMYWCLNLTTGEEGVPECVLIRALQPVHGVDLMKQRRRGKNDLRHLCSGPGKLCTAMGIDSGLYGYDLRGPEIFVRRPEQPVPVEVETSCRIGVDYAGEDACRPWRFTVAGSPFVSRKVTRP